MSESYSGGAGPSGAPQGASETGSATPKLVSVRMPLVKPVASYALIGLTVLVYILQEASGFMTGSDLVASLGMKINELIIAGQYWRLITPVFLHGSVLHIVFNMYALYALGPDLERFSGHGRFLALYLLSGFAGNVASFIFTPAPSLGSSTAIFGLLAAEGVFLYKNRKLFGGYAQRALQRVIFFGLFNLILGAISPQLDNWGHVGGLAAGLVFAWLAGPVLIVKGLQPDLYLEDEREPLRVFQAAVGLLLIISIIVGAAIYLRGT